MVEHRCRSAGESCSANKINEMTRQLENWCYGSATVFCVAFWSSAASAVNNALYAAAMESITTDELYHYVEVLADDVYEGRASGSRGGHAAAQWLIQQLRPFQLRPGGTDGGYVQKFGDDCRNILVLQPGDDPQLQNDVLI